MNFDKTERDSLIARGLLARCDTAGKEFSVGPVEVLQRYADCSVFRCPACGKAHDDRPAWHGPRERRMGYTVVTQPSTDRWGALWA